MKKIIATLVGLTLGFGSAFAQSISIQNTFGANSENLSTYHDFVEINRDGTKQFNLSDRIQFDVNCDKLYGRVRTEIKTGSASLSYYDPAGNLDYAMFRLSPEPFSLLLNGYVAFRPFDWFHIAGGNSFFSKYAMDCAYLYASDDCTIHGKLLAKGGVGVLFDFLGVKVALQMRESFFQTTTYPTLNVGVSYSLANVFEVGATVYSFQRGFNETDLSASLFAGLNCVENFVFNLGYTYNLKAGSVSNLDGDYLASSEHALQLSTGYDLKDFGLKCYIDLMTGLTNSAGTYSGKYPENGVPFYSALTTSYKINDDCSIGLTTKYGFTPQSLTYSDRNVLTLYAYCDYVTKVGDFRCGLRAKFNNDGFYSLGIPLSWNYRYTWKKN